MKHATLKIQKRPLQNIGAISSELYQNASKGRLTSVQQCLYMCILYTRVMYRIVLIVCPFLHPDVSTMVQLA